MKREQGGEGDIDRTPHWYIGTRYDIPRTFRICSRVRCTTNVSRQVAVLPVFHGCFSPYNPLIPFSFQLDTLQSSFENATIGKDLYNELDKVGMLILG